MTADATTDYLLFLGILPVVIRREDGALCVVEFKEWIRQRISHAKTTQGRADGADDYSLGLISTYNITRDENVLALVDAASRGDIRQGRAGERIQIVELDQRDAGRVVRAGDLSRVIAGR
jgi:hypothetical protein